jgi:sugar lactone lactonase YvrE
MFFIKPDNHVNPYAYDLKSLSAGDSSRIMYTETQQFGTGLTAIHGIALDHADRIYVCGENGFEIYDPAGKIVSKSDLEGTVSCIFVDQGGRIYLGMQDHVEIFDHSGRQMMKWKTCGDNAIITSIAVTGRNVYVADAGNKVVYHYDLSGNLVQKTGEKDPARGIPGFVIPSPYFDLGIGSAGELWVVNPGRHQFEQYNDGGDLISSWGISSMTLEGFCGCCNPSNFAFLSDGSFVTAEKGIERIKVYGPDGAFKCLVAGPDAFIEGTRGIDVAVDSKDRIFALDPEKKLIRIFSLNKQN